MTGLLGKKGLWFFGFSCHAVQDDTSESRVNTPSDRESQIMQMSGADLIKDFDNKVARHMTKER